MVLREGAAASLIAQGVLRAISHVDSGGDCSVHVTLSPQDYIKFLDAGWGRRLGLTGVKALKTSYGCHFNTSRSMLLETLQRYKVSWKLSRLLLATCRTVKWWSKFVQNKQ